MANTGPQGDWGGSKGNAGSAGTRHPGERSGPSFSVPDNPSPAHDHNNDRYIMDATVQAIKMPLQHHLCLCLAFGSNG